MLCLSLFVLLASHPTAETTPKEALKAFNDLIGSWKATGTPEGNREDKQRGFWTETLTWEWQFRGKDSWLKFDADKGKHFMGGELRYLPSEDKYQLTARTPAKTDEIYTGELKGRTLSLDRTDDKTGDVHRVVIKLLHSNRYLYRYEVKAKGRTLFARRYEVGATKEGEPFAAGGNAAPVCIVSGGLGTIRVAYKGREFFVCCSGCKTAFDEDPEKFIKEFEMKNKGK